MKATGRAPRAAKRRGQVTAPVAAASTRGRLRLPPTPSQGYMLSPRLARAAGRTSASARSDTVAAGAAPPKLFACVEPPRSLRAHQQSTLRRRAPAADSRICGPAVWPRLRFTESLGPSAATASATICSTPDGSAASAAASAVQPPAAATACARRSRASITATSTSSRCTPNGGLSRRPACVPVGCAHACMRACVRLCVLRPMPALASLASPMHIVPLCVRWGAQVTTGFADSHNSLQHGSAVRRRRTSERTHSCAKQTDTSARVARAA